ncbi:MAG: atpF [Ilumatobacteraceae bacterium]|nr:atpF [Ilumatobacteraceae bacterium]
MSIHTILQAGIGHFVSEGNVTIDSDGIVTHSSFWPETAEIIYGGIASILVFALLIKFAGPAVTKALAARTAKIQKELDGAADDKRASATEAADIRQALGDIGAERGRLLAEAAAQAEALVADFNTRLDDEIAELHARAAADIVTAKGRQSDELRAEISRLSSAAAERAVAESIDEATHQQLIEAFIQKAGSMAGSASA